MTLLCTILLCGISLCSVAANDPVQVFSEPNFTGQSMTFDTMGTYQAEDLGPLDNTIRSLFVPPDTMVRLSDNADGSGMNWLFRPGWHDRIGGALNGTASRVEVFPRYVDRLQDLIAGGGTVSLEPNARYEQSSTVEINNQNGLVIDGRGATIVLTDPNVDGVRITGSVNTTLRDIKIDYDPLPFTQGVIVNSDPNQQWGDLAIDTGYPTDPTNFNAVPEINGGNLWDPETLRMRSDRSKHFIPDPLEQIEPGLLRVRSWNLQVGDLMSVHIPWRGVGLRCDRSESCQFIDVTIHAAPGGAFYGTGGLGGHKLSRCVVTRGPTLYGDTPRLYSVNRDAFHYVAMQTGPTLVNCRAEFMSDDGVNIHGNFVDVVTVQPDGWVRMTPGYPGSVGDVVEIHEANSLLPVAKTTIAELGNSPEWLRLADVGTAKPGDVGILQRHQCDGTVVRDCEFSDLEGRGIIIRSSNSTVVRNTIRRPTISGIWIGPEIGFYREPSFPSRVTVRDNRLYDIGHTIRSMFKTERLLGAINVVAGVDTPEAAAATADGREIERVIVADNLVEGAAAAGIFLRGVSRSRISGNELIRTNQRFPWELGEIYATDPSRPNPTRLIPDAAIVIHDSKIIRGDNNVVSEPGEGYQQPLQATDQTDRILVTATAGG